MMIRDRNVYFNKYIRKFQFQIQNKCVKVIIVFIQSKLYSSNPSQRLSILFNYDYLFNS